MSRLARCIFRLSHTGLVLHLTFTNNQGPVAFFLLEGRTSNVVYVGVHKGRGILLCLVDLLASLNGIFGLTLPAQHQTRPVHTIKRPSFKPSRPQWTMYRWTYIAPVRHLESNATHVSANFEIANDFGNTTERPRPTCTNISYRTSKMVPVLSVFALVDKSWIRILGTPPALADAGISIPNDMIW